jgi:hypothetical protein
MGDGSQRQIWSRQGLSIQELEARVEALTEAVETNVAIAEGAAFTPLFLNTSGGVYPPRPATPRPIIFTDPLVRPAANGSISGGGGMVPQLDLWLS